MDLAHHIYQLITGGKLYLAPIESPRRVLDLGTGTGIWAIDFAEYVIGYILVLFIWIYWASQLITCV